jgi:nicotinate phosphoribosyltransferase
VWASAPLVTASTSPALGGIYKSAALRELGGAWRHKIKLGVTAKISTPGIQQAGARGGDGSATRSAICRLARALTIVDPDDPIRRKVSRRD